MLELATAICSLLVECIFPFIFEIALAMTPAPAPVESSDVPGLQSGVWAHCGLFTDAENFPMEKRAGQTTV